MRTLSTLLLTALVLTAQSDSSRKLPVHTQVREDIFAGWMVKDLDRFNQGVKRVDEILAANPNDAGAMAWKGGALLFQSVLAYEGGDMGRFRRIYRESKEWFDRAYKTNASDGGVLAVTGGSYIVFADRLPPEFQKEGNEMARKMFTELEEQQRAGLDKFPVHFRGEVWSALAQSEQRLGNWAASKVHLERIVAKMDGTPYKTRAAAWLEKPESAGKTSLTCLTCHDPGRLQNRLAAMQKPPAP